MAIPNRPLGMYDVRDELSQTDEISTRDDDVLGLVPVDVTESLAVLDLEGKSSGPPLDPIIFSGIITVGTTFESGAYGSTAHGFGISGWGHLNNFGDLQPRYLRPGVNVTRVAQIKRNSTGSTWQASWQDDVGFTNVGGPNPVSCMEILTMGGELLDRYHFEWTDPTPYYRGGYIFFATGDGNMFRGATSGQFRVNLRGVI